MLLFIFTPVSCLLPQFECATIARMPAPSAARSHRAPAARDHDELAHGVACDGIELLGNRLRALLRSPRHDGALINQYASALVALHGAARIARSSTAASAPGAPGQDAPTTSSAASALVVPGIISDRATWESVYASSVAAVKRVVDEATRAVGKT